MNRALFLILALSGLLALGYSWATPYGAAPDEGAHVRYVARLVSERRLPTLNLEQRRNLQTDVDYESHQPPFYYVTAAPFYLAGKAIAGDTGAAHACRILSILFGLGGTFLVWRVARDVAPDRPALWTAAAGFAALLPMRLSVMASVSNDSLAEATSTFALLCMIWGVKDGWTRRSAIRLGVALSLAVLAKQSAILLFPVAMVAVYLGVRQATVPPVEGTRAVSGRKQRRAAEPESAPAAPGADTVKAFLRAGVTALVPLLLLAGWWFVRNHLLYGDPLGQKAFNWYFEDTPLWEDFKDQGWPFVQYLRRLVLPTAFASFWGAFGHLNPSEPELFMGAYGPGEPGAHWGYPPKSWLYPILAAAVAASVVGWLLYFRRNRSAGRGPISLPVVVLALHALFVGAAFLNFNSTYFQAQGRYFFPAMAALSLAHAGGWLELARRREVRAAWVLVFVMTTLAAYALFGVLVPGFRR